MEIPSKNTFDSVLKYGAAGVLLLWVLRLEVKMNAIEIAYRDCMEDRIEDVQRKIRYSMHDVYAVKPKRTAVIKWGGNA